jgi:pyruvate dehydrogenase E2 component (dihydrolipoamide acetyltransferase)
VDSFVAIINPPHAAILAVGSAKPTPIVKDGKVDVATMMNLTVSGDHRVTDGAEAARFLGEVKRLLENPVLLLTEAAR